MRSEAGSKNQFSYWDEGESSCHAFGYNAKMNCDLDTSIPDWIVEHPETSRVFSELELDTSCAGKSLGYVCIHQGLSTQEVLQRLSEVIASTADDDNIR
ncbi:MAG: hypothetical protein WBD31_21805 [Rubripirellula sp.]